MSMGKNWVKVIALGLSAALLLAGCGSGDQSGGDKSGTGTDVSTSEPSGSKSEGPVDYSKYNSYLDLAEEIGEKSSLFCRCTSPMWTLHLSLL